MVGHNGFDRAPRCVLCAPATTSVFFLHRQDLKSRTKSRTFRGRKITLPKGSCDLWSHLPPRCRAARNRAKRSSWTTCVSPPCVSTAGFRKRTGDFVSRAGPKIAGNTVPTVVVFFAAGADPHNVLLTRSPRPNPITRTSTNTCFFRRRSWADGCGWSWYGGWDDPSHIRRSFSILLGLQMLKSSPRPDILSYPGTDLPFLCLPRTHPSPWLTAATTRRKCGGNGRRGTDRRVRRDGRRLAARMYAPRRGRRTDSPTRRE